tara:strand:- start:5017 stop:6549 length:1533 start_codon:yes stop_codon:yes gene_type:complete
MAFTHKVPDSLKANGLITLEDYVDIEGHRLAGQQVGDLIYVDDERGGPVRLAVGTAGQFLRVNSGATAPEWSDTLSADSFVADGFGLTIGHTAQLTTSTGDGDTDLIPELQIIGTGQADSSALLAAFSATATRAAAPTIALVKSGAATVAVGTVVTADEILGSIIAYGDDGTDIESPAGAIEFAVDGTPGTGDMPGRIVLYTTVDAGETLTEAMRVTATQDIQFRTESQLWLGPAAAGSAFTHGNITTGFTINQEASDNVILAFKSSDVGTGFTTGPTGPDVEVDDFFTLSKARSTGGGIWFQALHDDISGEQVMVFESLGGTATTTKTTSGRGLVDFFIAENDGSNGRDNIAADGNILSIRARVGGADVARFLLDEDGDIFVVSVTDVTGAGNAVTATAFDEYDDASMLRAFDTGRHAQGIIRTEWDGFVRDNEESLLNIGVIGAPIDDGGMWNLTQHTRLLTGAAWQAAEDVTSIAKALLGILTPGQRREAAGMFTPRLNERLALMEA